MPEARRLQIADVELPSGRDIAALTPAACLRLLERADVAFEALPAETAPRVATPITLLEPLRGVSFAPRGGPDNERAIVDCRLAVALLAWTRVLREAGVVFVEHYSSYRKGARIRGSGRPSGHSRALAMDGARFTLDDGRVLDIEQDWEQRERRGPPCPERTDEGEDGRLLRHLVCEAVAQDLFQVVLTPHHDRDHQNHVHLELVPEVDWSYVK